MRWIEAHQLAIFVRDALQNLYGLVRPESLFTIPRIVEVFITVLNVYGEAEFSELGLFVAASSLLSLTNLDAFSQIKNSTETSLTVLDSEKILSIFDLLQVIVGLRVLLLLVWTNLARQELRAIEADALEDLGQIAEHTLVVHGTVERDVTEVPGARLHTCSFEIFIMSKNKNHFLYTYRLCKCSIAAPCQ